MTKTPPDSILFQDISTNSRICPTAVTTDSRRAVSRHRVTSNTLAGEWSGSFRQFGFRRSTGHQKKAADPAGSAAMKSMR
jgi:hypothetical protein